MGCSNNPEVNFPNHERNIIITPNNDPLEKIDFSEPFKTFEHRTTNFLFLKDKKIIFGDRNRIIHVYENSNFESSYEINLFSSHVQCMIELSDGNIVACSNDCTMKVFKISDRNYEIINDYNYSDELWAMDELGETCNFVVGSQNGGFFKCQKINSNIIYGQTINIKESSVLNIFSLSESLIMITYMNYGAYFYDFNISKTIGHVPHKYFNPFKCVIQKISDHELLIGAEYSIVLIDYKKFEKIKEFDNDASYSLLKLSNDYLLTSYGEGYLRIYKMLRDENGQLELKSEKEIKIIDGIISGIQLCPDGKLITFNMNNCIKIWNTKNTSK